MEKNAKLRIALEAAVNKKAENPVVIKLKGLTGLTDYFLILTANSDVHARTIADEIEEKLKDKGIKPFNVEGYKLGDWILLDYGDLIVHIFKPKVREYYNLEGLWMDAPRLDVKKLMEAKT